MIQKSLKNFFQNLVYIFIPMGIVYLCLLVTIFFLISTIFNSLGMTIQELAELIHASVSSSTTSVQDFLSYAMNQIDWNQGFLETIEEVLDTNWIQSTLSGFFETISASTVGFEEEFTQIIENFASTMIFSFIFAVVFSFLGILFANFITRFVLRRKTAKRNMKKFIIAHTIVPITQSILIALSCVLVVYIQYYTILVVIFSLGLLSVISLLSSWIVYKNSNLKLKDVLNMKHIAQHLGFIAIVIGMNIVFGTILMFINPLFAILLMIPIVIYSLNMIDLNTDAYVSSLITVEEN